MPDRNGPPVDADTFRAVMGSVCTPVTQCACPEPRSQRLLAEADGSRLARGRATWLRESGTQICGIQVLITGGNRYLYLRENAAPVSAGAWDVA